jgi:hypothetical protein
MGTGILNKENEEKSGTVNEVRLKKYNPWMV